MRQTNQPPLYPANRLVYTVLIRGLKVLKLRWPFREPMVDGRSPFHAHAFPPFLPPNDGSRRRGVVMEQESALTRTSTAFCGESTGQRTFQESVVSCYGKRRGKVQGNRSRARRRVSAQSPQMVTTTLSCDLRFSICRVHPEPSHHRLRRTNGNGVVHRPLQVGSEGPFRSTLRGPTGSGREK